jgi:probable DNA metabolism protein
VAPAQRRRQVVVAHDADVAGFREAARGLLAGHVAPEDVAWHVASAAQGGLDLFDDTGPDAATAAAETSVPRMPMPAFFLPLCEHAALHADMHRFALLYRLAWRLVHEPGLRHDPLDADRMQAEELARQVRRDMHKMTAFVRFRPLASAQGDAPLHMAWFEPGHHIVDATAPFFARRFAQMRWAILTPRRSVRWDGHHLAFGDGARRDAAPGADADEGLWLTYYQHIFNPARLKLRMMHKEMPRRYWQNLPEAVLIQPLVAAAALRSGRMVEADPSTPVHRRPAASLALRITQEAAPSAPPDSLPALRRQTNACRACPIGAMATQAVHGAGPTGARLMLVGEQPGDQEDLQGRPFAGPAGQLVDRALAQLGWPRDTLYLTNALKHFKYVLRGQRRMHKTASQQEAAACLQWLDHEIALVGPQAAIALGATAARALLGRPVAVTTERGQWFTRHDGLRVLVTLHPAALLRMDGGATASHFAQWVDDLQLAAGYAVPQR